MKLITKIILGVAAIPFSIGFIAAVIGPPTPQQRAAAAQQAAEAVKQQAASDAANAQFEKRASLRGAAKLAVLMQLKDPGSAEFGEVLVMNDGVVCGTVNAKNSFGGYVGASHFLDDHGLLVLLQESPHFAHYWNKLCANKQGYDE